MTSEQPKKCRWRVAPSTETQDFDVVYDDLGFLISRVERNHRGEAIGSVPSGSCVTGVYSFNPSDQSDIKQHISDQALKLVNGARRSTYGAPTKNFSCIARLWTAHLKNIGVMAPEAPDLHPREIAAMMRQVKEARLAESPDHLDSYIDLLGYGLCGAEAAAVELVDKEKAA